MVCFVLSDCPDYCKQCTYSEKYSATVCDLGKCYENKFQDTDKDRNPCIGELYSWHVESYPYLSTAKLDAWMCSITVEEPTKRRNEISTPIDFLFRFYRAAMECRRGLTIRILYVCPSVRPSIKRVNCDKTKEKSVNIFYTVRKNIYPSFWEEEWLVGWPLLPEILCQPALVGAKSPILNR